MLQSCRNSLYRCAMGSIISLVSFMGGGIGFGSRPRMNPKSMWNILPSGCTGRELGIVMAALLMYCISLIVADRGRGTGVKVTMVIVLIVLTICIDHHCNDKFIVCKSMGVSLKRRNKFYSNR